MGGGGGVYMGEYIRCVGMECTYALASTMKYIMDEKRIGKFSMIYVLLFQPVFQFHHLSITEE